MQPGILSQSEIDALLANISAGEPEESPTPVAVANKAVKAYNFRRPDKFSKEQVRSLQLLHEAMARSMVSTLSGRLRGMVQMALVSVEQGTYDDYIRQIQDNTIINIVSMSPLPGHMVMELSLPASFMLVDRLLGGPGRPLERMRSVTEIELALLRGLVIALLDDIREGWRKVVEVDPRLEEMALNSQSAQITFATDAVMVVAYEIKIADTSGTMTFCLPYSLLEPIATNLSARMLFNEGKKGQQANVRYALEKSVRQVELPVVVRLGGATILARDLLGLRVGDVVRLDVGVSEEVRICVGDQARFTGRPGRRGAKLAIRLSKTLEIEQPVAAR
ncbi:MAG: flagellar motor switch protein FliM [Chloroflexota bacterium]